MRRFAISLTPANSWNTGDSALGVGCGKCCGGKGRADDRRTTKPKTELAQTRHAKRRFFADISMASKFVFCGRTIKVVRAACYFRSAACVKPVVFLNCPTSLFGAADARRARGRGGTKGAEGAKMARWAHGDGAEGARRRRGGRAETARRGGRAEGVGDGSEAAPETARRTHGGGVEGARR